MSWYGAGHLTTIISRLCATLALTVLFLIVWDANLNPVEQWSLLAFIALSGFGRFLEAFLGIFHFEHVWPRQCMTCGTRITSRLLALAEARKQQTEAQRRAEKAASR